MKHDFETYNEYMFYRMVSHDLITLAFTLKYLEELNPNLIENIFLHELNTNTKQLLKENKIDINIITDVIKDLVPFMGNMFLEKALNYSNLHTINILKEASLGSKQEKILNLIKQLETK